MCIYFFFIIGQFIIYLIIFCIITISLRKFTYTFLTFISGKLFFILFGIILVDVFYLYMI